MWKKNDEPQTTRPTASDSPTVIGPGLTIRGEIVSEEAVELAGRLEGDSRIAGRYRVRDGGCVIGTIEAQTLAVEGTVQSPEVVADRLELGASGRLEAHVRARVVVVAAGAQFDGELEMAPDRNTRP